MTGNLRTFLAGLLALLSALALTAPSAALAAGFAKDPIFLSKTPVTEGQSVHVYAVISNTDAAAFAGTLVFYDANTKIGSTAVTLAAGATETASILWTPSAGTHSVNAQLVAQDGTIAEQVAEDFTVNAKPQPVTEAADASQTAASIDSSAAIQKDIAGVSPQVASASEPVFSAMDSARNSIADALDGQINSTQQKINATPKPGVVEGTSTADMSLPSPSSVWYWAYVVYLYILQGLRWLVGNAGVFYPVIAIAFLYLIYSMYRRYRRPY